MQWLDKSTKRQLLEMSAVIILYNLMLGVFAWVFLPRISYPVIPVLQGLFTGAAGAILMLVHMAAVLERALGCQDEAYANKVTIVQRLLRYFVFVTALIVCRRVFQIDILAAVIGAMGMKAAAYMQPLICKASGWREAAHTSRGRRKADARSGKDAWN